MGTFCIENGIDPGDPASFDAFMEGHARGSMDGAWEYAGRKAAQQWKEEAEEEAILMAKFQATGVARNRLQREQPHLSRSENIRLAEAEAETTWKDWIDDFRPRVSLAPTRNLETMRLPGAAWMAAGSMLVENPHSRRLMKKRC